MVEKMNGLGNIPPKSNNRGEMSPESNNRGEISPGSNRSNDISRRRFLQMGAKALAGAVATSTILGHAGKAEASPKGNESPNLDKLKSQLDGMYNALSHLQNDAEQIFSELLKLNLDLDKYPSHYTYMTAKYMTSNAQKDLKDVPIQPENEHLKLADEAMKEVRNLINQALSEELSAISKAIDAVKTKPNTEGTLIKLQTYQKKLKAMYNALNK